MRLPGVPVEAPCDRSVDEDTARAGVTPDDDALAVYRLWWDLTDVSTGIAQFREPHHDDEDMLIAWSALDHHLDPVRWRAIR